MKALIEAVKEAARGVVLAIIPIVIMGIDTDSGTFNVNWVLVQLTAIVTVLRFVDSWLHEQGKASKNETMEGGLTRF